MLLIIMIMVKLYNHNEHNSVLSVFHQHLKKENNYKWLCFCETKLYDEKSHASIIYKHRNMFYSLTLSVVGFILCSLCSIYPKLTQDLSNS